MQFDTAAGGVAARAVDGKANSNFPGRTCTHTQSKGRTNKNWWAVDLQARYIIKRVEVVNRGDCCCKLCS
jgi:hypothetical protein